jgi:hypothetical protein
MRVYGGTRCCAAQFRADCLCFVYRYRFFPHPLIIHNTTDQAVYSGAVLLYIKHCHHTTEKGALVPLAHSNRDSGTEEGAYRNKHPEILACACCVCVSALAAVFLAACRATLNASSPKRPLSLISFSLARLSRSHSLFSFFPLPAPLRPRGCAVKGGRGGKTTRARAQTSTSGGRRAPVLPGGRVR